MSTPPFTAPDWPGQDGHLEPLVRRLADLDGPADEAGTWSEPLWQAVVEAGANLWTLPPEFGGAGLARSELIRHYARLAEGSLTAAFILTQYDAAVRRLAPAANRGDVADWLRAIGRGEAFATVGVSQLTTSRRHGEAAMVARTRGDGFVLDGVMPWVTAAERADVFVTGAVTEDRKQLLIALPADREGVSVEPSFALAALQASCTAEVRCESVEVVASDLLAGPMDDVSKVPGMAGTGGLETSTLALGLARAALVSLGEQAGRRDDLIEPGGMLAESWSNLADDLLAAAEGRPGAPAPGEVRRRANSLALRCTQAYLSARKGTGFLRTEPAQRWAREALFFLVWSCPSPVAAASIRDLAGLCEA